MRLENITALVAAFLLCAATGCHLGGAGASGCGPAGCDAAGGCDSGACSGLSGLLGSRLGGRLGGLGSRLGNGGCLGGDCQGDCPNCVTPAQLTGDGYGVRGGLNGPLAQFVGRHHRGPQSHMGGMPGPADGPPVAQVTYPYYTTRGPRDYFASQPASIGP